MDAFFSSSPAETSTSQQTSTPDTGIETADEDAPSIEPAEYDYSSGPPTQQQPRPSQQQQQAAPQEEQQQQPDVPAGEEEDEIDVSKIDPNARSVSVDRSRFNNILQNHKMATAIKQFAPSVEAARANYEQANDLQSMYSDFTSGTERGIDGFLNFWQNENPQAFAHMASRAIALAPREVQEQISDGAVWQMIEERYAGALQTGSQVDLHKARLFDYGVTGHWRTDQQLAAAPKPDPWAEERARLEERDRHVTAREQQQAQSVWQNFSGGVHRGIQDAVAADVDNILKAAAQGYGPAVYRAVRNDGLNQIFDAVRKDGEWLKAFNREFNGSIRSMNEETRQNLVSQYQAKARQYMRSVLKPLMAQATQNAMTQNQQQHDNRARSQDRRNVISGGRPNPIPAAPQNGRPMNLDDKMSAFWQQQDAAASAASRR
jgi:hypothetical protein